MEFYSKVRVIFNITIIIVANGIEKRETRRRDQRNVGTESHGYQFIAGLAYHESPFENKSSVYNLLYCVTSVT